MVPLIWQCKIIIVTKLFFNKQNFLTQNKYYYFLDTTSYR